MIQLRLLATSLLAPALSPAAWSQTAPPLWQPAPAPLARGGASPEPGR